jgi:hypothetical protein
MVMEFNYASVELEKTSDDIKVVLAIKSYDNDDVVKKEILVNKELTFDKKLLRYNSMCTNMHTTHSKTLLINRLFESFIKEKSFWYYFDLYLFVNIILVMPVIVFVYIYRLVFKYQIQ